jgi:hypothetical protein
MAYLLVFIFIQNAPDTYNIFAAPAQEAIERVRGGLSDNEVKLLDEYMVNLDRLREFYKKITITVIEEELFREHGLDGTVEKYREKTFYVYRGNGSLQRLDINPILDERQEEELLPSRQCWENSILIIMRTNYSSVSSWHAAHACFLASWAG